MGQIKAGTRVTKNMIIVRLITDPNEIVTLAKAGKSIYVTHWDRTSPASFIMSMHFRQVVDWMNNNVFYKVEKDEQIRK